MDTGCSRSLTVFDQVLLHNASNNNEANQYSRNSPFAVRSILLLLAFSTFFAIPSILIAQNRAPQNLTAPDYSVSIDRLKVPPKAWSHLQVANKQFSKKDLEGAEREIERALQADPDCGAAFSMRAFIKLAAKDPKGAAEDAAHAVAIDSHDADSFIALAMANNSLRNFQDAAAAADWALHIRPDSWQARLEMAKSLYGQKRLSAALEQLNAVETDFPDVHLVRANILMGLGRCQDAASEFRAFLRQEPYDVRDEQIRRIITATAVDSGHPNSAQN